MNVYHILVQHEYEAKDILLKLSSSKSLFNDFQNLAMKYSKCSSAKTGGDLGPCQPHRYVESFREAVETLKPETVSVPIRSQFGYHLIFMK